MNLFLRKSLVVKFVLVGMAAVPFLVSASTLKTTRRDSTAPEQVLKDSSRAFYLNDYEASLRLLETYFAALGSQPPKRARVTFQFYAVAAMGRIYLQHKQDPEGAIRWLEKIEKAKFLAPAERDIVDGWIAGVKDWIKLGKYPHDTHDSGTLYDLGKKYYDSGLKKQKYPMDPVSTADFSIASGYLVPFIVHNDKDSKIGEALFMMGDMRRRLWGTNDFWSENYYLTETIRRFPGTALAVKAYRALDEDVHFGYTGTSGDSTPSSWITLLAEFKRVAHKPSEIPSSTAAPLN